MRWVAITCLLCLGLTAGAASERDWGKWAEEVRKQHPLAGTFYVASSDIWGSDRRLYPISAKFQGFLWFPMVLGKRGGFLLFGEVHDNPVHHQLRAWLINLHAKPRREWRPGVVFEQIRADQKVALDRFKALAETGSGAADDLFQLLEWDKSGWPRAQIYKPLFEVVLAAKLPIYAGDPPRGAVRAIARGGLSALPPEERARLRLDEPMPAPLLDSLRKELADGHCGLLTAEAVENMAAAQRYRDAHLADALLSAAERYHQAAVARGEDPFMWALIPHQPAILVAGNGHLRKDRGVPWHLRLRAPSEVAATFLAAATTFLLVEVVEGKTDPELYMPRDPAGKPAADLLIFTPRAERADPCEAMRKMKR